MHRTRFAALLGLLLTVSLLATACNSKPAAPAPATGDSTAAAAAKPPKKVSLILDWYPNAVHSFIYAAVSQGYFKAEGLDVDIKMPADDPTAGIKLVGTGSETFALYYQPDTLMAREEGVPVVSIGAVVRHPLNGLMVPTASGIKSPKDLVGKQIGFPGIPLNQALVNTMVAKDGGDPTKVKLTDVSFDLIPAIATKKTDGIAGGFLNHEKLVLEKQGIPMTYFAPQDWGVPNYYELVLITGEQTLKNDPATVAAFWRALAKGQEYVTQHPDDALKLVLDKQDKEFPLDKDVETQSLKLLLPLMSDAQHPFGSQSADDWKNVAAWLKQAGLIKGTTDPNTAFANPAK